MVVFGLAWTWSAYASPITWFITALGVYIGICGARQMRPLFGAVFIAAMLAGSVAGSEAAQYHIGRQSELWFLAGISCGGICVLMTILSFVFARSPGSHSS